jgi:aerobic-type carbon monoxide dehydrogenase small subunit (CoxS/CutS family)
VPALVTPAAFALAQHRLATNKARAMRNNHHPDVALLRGGFARCGYCDQALIVMFTPRDKTYQYRCSSRSQVTSTCHQSMLCADLDAIAWSKIDAILHTPALIAQQLAVQDQTADTVAEDLAAIASRDMGLARQQAKLVDALAHAGETTTALIEERLALIEKERQRLAIEREMIQAHQAAPHRHVNALKT